MSDVKMPDSQPCKFDNGWAGKCAKPSDNGWCSKHENAKCASCKKKAIGSCDVDVGPLVCGAPLCGDCTHSVGKEGGHVTNLVYKEMQKRKEKEEEEKVASRTSRIQRIDPELGIPLNLFELKKGDTSEYPIKEFFYLELTHGLMGCFPVILYDTDRIVITIDRQLLERVWKMLHPRRSEMVVGHGYVSEKHSVVYPITGTTQYEMERSIPDRFLNEAEFHELTKGGVNPFNWAPGLLGSDMSEEEFLASIKQAAKHCGIST